MQNEEIIDDLDNEGFDNTGADAPIEPKPFSPLTAEPVNQKSYAVPNFTGDPKQTYSPIEEPIFTPPPINTSEPIEEPKGPTQPLNPQMSSLPPKEKKNAAAQAVTMAIGGYELVHQLANKAVQIGDGKVKKLTREKKIDINIPIRIGDGQMPMYEFIREFNQESNDVFSVSQSFKDEIRPPLERLFEKKGIGASDSDMVVYLVGKDLAWKIPRFIQLLGVKKDMLHQLQDVTEEYKKYNAQQGGGNSAPPPPPQTPPPPPRQDTKPPYTPPPQTPPMFDEAIPFEEEPIPEPKDYGAASTIFDETDVPKPKKSYKKRSNNAAIDYRPARKKNRLNLD